MVGSLIIPSFDMMIPAYFSARRLKPSFFPQLLSTEVTDRLRHVSWFNDSLYVLVHSVIFLVLLFGAFCQVFLDLVWSAPFDLFFVCVCFETGLKSMDQFFHPVSASIELMPCPPWNMVDLAAEDSDIDFDDLATRQQTAWYSMVTGHDRI